MMDYNPIYLPLWQVKAFGETRAEAAIARMCFAGISFKQPGLIPA